MMSTKLRELFNCTNRIDDIQELPVVYFYCIKGGIG